MITIGVQPRWLEHLITGAKKVEGKKDSSTWGFLKHELVPQEIIMHNEQHGDDYREYVFIMTYVRCYNNLHDYLNGEGLTNCLPGIETIEQGVEEYLKFWSEQDLNNGILAIGVKFLRQN